MDLKKNNLDFDYQSLLHDIMSNGVEKETRNGTTISVFGRQIHHNMSDGFPLLTTKKMAWKQIVIELLWFLRGDTNIKYLHTPHTDVDCNIWDGDAYKNYCKHFMDEYLEKNTIEKYTKLYPNATITAKDDWSKYGGSYRVVEVKFESGSYIQFLLR